MTEALDNLSPKQRLFVEAYLACWNATEAAKRAGYSEATARQQGSRLLTNVDIQKAVSVRMAEAAMPADEVLMRLAQHARGSMGDFVKVDEEGQPQGFAFGPDRPQHLIKKLAITDKGITFELYDAQAALITLARHHGLLIDRAEVTGRDGAPLSVEFINDWRNADNQDD